MRCTENSLLFDIALAGVMTVVVLVALIYSSAARVDADRVFIETRAMLGEHRSHPDD